MPRARFQPLNLHPGENNPIRDWKKRHYNLLAICLSFARVLFLQMYLCIMVKNIWKKFSTWYRKPHQKSVAYFKRPLRVGRRRQLILYCINEVIFSYKVIRRSSIKKELQRRLRIDILESLWVFHFLPGIYIFKTKVWYLKLFLAYVKKEPIFIKLLGSWHEYYVEKQKNV